MVCTQVDRSTWDRQLFPNPHTFVIYLEFVHVCAAAPKMFKECKCEDDDDGHLHCQTWILGDGHYCWLRGPFNPLSMKHQDEYLACTIHHILDFF
jgi:hypothetical protein